MRFPSPKASARRVFVALVVFSLAMFGAIGYVWRASSRVSAEHLPLVRASARIKMDTTLAHLWFEEILSGDRNESMEEVWSLLESARSYSRAMIEGGRDAEGPIAALQDPALRGLIRGVEAKLSEFESITHERQSAQEGAASGTAIDQRYDAVFDELVAMMDELEESLHEVIRRETRSGRRVQLFVMAGAFASAVLLGIVFVQFSGARERAEENLRQKVRAEKEAREHLDKLAHVVRLATMSELAAEIAHEIRQPLAAISASAAACRRWIDADETDSGKLSVGLRLIQEEAARANDVLQRLRAFVEKGESRYELVDVNDVVQAAVRLTRFDPQMRAARVRLDLAPTLPPVEADAVQIQQVVLNLVRNAVEATPRSALGSGEAVIVRTRLAAQDEIEISVVDHGTGLPEEITRHPFRPFVTTKESGMGLGLSICHSIVTAHGGRIRLSDNGLQPGADIGFTLPAVEGNAT